jgi:hypothetical protein
MNRRAFIATATAILVAPLAAEAQRAGQVARIGVLLPGTAARAARSPTVQAFFEELRSRLDRESERDY